MPESVYAKKGDMGPQDHLSQDEVQAVVVYIKNFSPKFASRRFPESLPIPPSPPSTAEAIDRGRRIYRKAGCDECHGSEGRGDGPSARDLSGETNRPYPATTQEWVDPSRHLPEYPHRARWDPDAIVLPHPRG